MGKRKYTNNKRKYNKKNNKTKSNTKLTKDVNKIQSTLNSLNLTSESLDIYHLDNGLEYLNAESSVQVYRITQDSRFTSKAVAESPNQIEIPQDAYRKGNELVLKKIDMYLQLVNRQSIYQTRLMVIQFKDNHDISRQIGGGGEYSPNALMTSNLAKWNIVGNIPNPLVVGNPGAGRDAHFAGLMMKQPPKDVADRYNAFYVLHDEVFTNPEVDQIVGQQIENGCACFKRSVYPKIKRLNFEHPYDDTPLNDIIAIVFNNTPRRGKWQNPNQQVESTRGHALNWHYKIYDN